MIESKLDFSFALNFNVEKFDDLPFYRKKFNKLPDSKGVDFLLTDNEYFVFMEVKNFKGYEGNNRWRIVPDNRKILSTNSDNSKRSSLDVEVAEKVAMTLACIVGAYTKVENTETAIFGKNFMERIVKQPLPKIKIILFLEGNFNSHSRSKEMIMLELSKSIRKKLEWLACDVLVEDLATHKNNYYTVKEIIERESPCAKN